MRCREFERIWNDRLDGASPVDDLRGSKSAPVFDHRLDQHAAVCPACRELATRFAMLEHALKTKPAPPRPSPQLQNRILNDAFRYQPPTFRDPVYFWSIIRLKLREHYPSENRPSVFVTAVAGVLLLLVITSFSIFAVLRSDRARERPPKIVVENRRFDLTDDANTSIPGPTGAPTLERALASASAATWQLARTASEPAASLGREFFEAAIPEPFQTAAVPIVVPDTTSASLTLGRISNRLSRSARPLSSAARRAFGFLSLPSIDQKPGRRAAPPTAKRA